MDLSCHPVSFFSRWTVQRLTDLIGDKLQIIWLSSRKPTGLAATSCSGQVDVTRLDHNRGAYYPTAGVMNMPYGLCVQDDRLIVADTANSRLLGFDLDEVRMDAGASRLAGQPDFARKGDNRWAPAVRDSLRWPYGVAACAPTVLIANSGNNRVFLCEDAP